MYLLLAATRRFSFAFRFLTSAFLAAFLCTLAFAQTFTSSITGTVTDPTGAAVSNAQVQIKNMATNGTRDTVSSNDGTYQISNLAPGTYQITVTAPGFKTFVQTNLICRRRSPAA